MRMSEKYWLTILFTVLRYLSIIFIMSGGAFVVLGVVINPWWFCGLGAWPLFIMLGIVNLYYIRALTKLYRLELTRIAS